MSSEATDHLSMADYHDVLMATNRSRSLIMGHLKNHVIAEIDKEIQVWILDETTRRKNELKPRLLEDKQMYYAQCIKKIKQEQDQFARADLKDYYSTCLTILKKEADALLKQEIAAYKESQRASCGPTEAPAQSALNLPSAAVPPLLTPQQPLQQPTYHMEAQTPITTQDMTSNDPTSKETPTANISPESNLAHTPSPLDSGPPLNPTLLNLLNQISECMDQLESRLLAPNTHPPQPKKNPTKPPLDPPHPPPPPPPPQTDTPTPPQNAWMLAPTS
jgi:hypothetical protein